MLTSVSELTPSPRRPSPPWWSPRGLVRVLGPALAVQLLLPAVLLGAMVAAMSVPNRMVVQHLAHDVSTHVYGPSYLSDGVGGQLDRFTECIAATQGVATRGTYTPLERAILSPRLASCDYSAPILPELAAAGGARPGERDHQLEYARYWNGYALISRPVIAVWGLAGARLVSFALLVAALVGLWTAVRRRRGAIAATALLAPLVLSTNLVTSPLAYSHALSLATALGLAAVVLRWGSAPPRLLALTVLAGGLYAFIDFLTNPALAWSLTTAAAVLTAGAGRGAGRGTGQGAGERVLLFLAGAGGWAVGYAATWASKWLIVGLHSGFDAIEREISEVGGTRLDGTMGGRVDLRLGASTLANWRMWSTVPPARVVAIAAVALLAVGVVVAAIRAVRRGADRGADRGSLVELALLVAAAALVPLWYEILKNHSEIHSFFTYRSLAGAAGILALAGAIGLRGAGRGAGRSSTSPGDPVPVP